MMSMGTPIQSTQMFDRKELQGQWTTTNLGNVLAVYQCISIITDKFIPVDELITLKVSQC